MQNSSSFIKRDKRTSLILDKIIIIKCNNNLSRDVFKLSCPYKIEDLRRNCKRGENN